MSGRERGWRGARNTQDDHASSSGGPAGSRLTTAELLALQLWARGCSVRQIGLLLLVRERAAGRWSAERGMTAVAREALGGAAVSLGCHTLEEAVTKARSRGLIL